jgi:hypothetical protein
MIGCISEVLESEVTEKQLSVIDVGIGQSSASWTSNVRSQWSVCSSDELADTTGGSDALLGDLGEELGANNASDLGELSLAEDLEETLKQIVY